ncbi:energy transducer TonB [Lysobacter yangpyeongensis]|uniref:Protein TonB n=1 Tax=Lysobacter yangpyeongensis TaxID=346182 RepID=A0ABW0SIG8_9GAMM
MTNSSAASRPPQRSFDFSAWLPSWRALLWMLGAFVLGLILFLLVWRGGDNDFYRAGPVAPPTAANPEYTPLPAPVAGESEDVSHVPPPAAADDEAGRPRLVETAPPPPPPAAPMPPPRPAAPVATSQPQPISSPAPTYPARALRNGEQGTVMVSVDIGPDGIPTSIDVARSSGSRQLDRAAVDAVRRWRFRPAMTDGRPTSGRVQIPITFRN